MISGSAFSPVRPQAGFTLIEVMIAIAVAAIGLLALSQLQVAATQGNATAQQLTTGATWASNRIEQLLRLPADDPLLTDANNNGTNGLAQTQAGGRVQADHFYTRDAQGNDILRRFGDAVPANTMPYAIFYNVAVDTPVANARTIRVIATWQDRSTPTTTVIDYVLPNL